MRVIADQADREVGRRLPEQLAADEIAVAVVEVGVVDDVVQEAVALAVDAVDAEGELVGDDRAGQRAGEADGVVIAVARFAIAAELEFGILRVDADRTRRRVAARQRTLRPAQHFDTLDFAQIVEAGAGAAAIDAVDEHRDRAFEAGVVAHRADAAQAGGRIRFRSGGRDDQRRRQLRHLADIGRARILERCGAVGTDGDRHVRQALRAARGGNNDIGSIFRFGFGAGLFGFGLLTRRYHAAQALRAGWRDGAHARRRRCQIYPLPHRLCPSLIHSLAEALAGKGIKRR
jgi:hypothetical protein